MDWGSLQHADIYADPLGWLLAAKIPPPEPFTFHHPPVPNLVSVVIPAYNASRFLNRCLQSVWEQDFPGGTLEILLCEDGSTDETYPLAVALQKRSPVPMRVLTHPGRANRGVSATRNLGIRHSRGAVIALLDADDRWLPGRLAIPLKYLTEHPETVCVGGLGEYRDASGRRVCGWNGGTTAGDYRLLDPNLGIRPPYTFEQMVRWYPLVNSTLTIRREAIATVQGYPESMAHQAEDWLLTAKLSLLAPIPLIERKLVEHTIHEASWTHRYSQESLAYGAQLEFLLHLVHWMLRQPEHRERGLGLFRQNYPKLLAGCRHAALLVEEYLSPQRQQGPSLADAPPAFFHYLGELRAELEELREHHRRTERFLAPLRRIPGLKIAARGLWRLSKYALRHFGRATTVREWLAPLPYGRGSS